MIALLSEAMVLGSTLVTPRRHKLLRDGEGCAFGMVLAANGRSEAHADDAGTFLLTNYPWMRAKTFDYPCNCYKGMSVYSNTGLIRRMDLPATADQVIVHLFDDHIRGCSLPKWTFDQLVAWVREHEEAPRRPNKEEETTNVETVACK
jgi:hypothetical protein